MKTLFSSFCALLLLILPAAKPAEVATPPRAAHAVKMALTTDEVLFTTLVGEAGTAIEKKDMKALGELMVPDYIHYTPDNGMAHKADELGGIPNWPPTTVKLLGTVQVRRSGNMAVTVSKHLYSSTENGNTMTQTIQHMIAWTLSGGKWQMAIVQSKKVQA